MHIFFFSIHIVSQQKKKGEIGDQLQSGTLHRFFGENVGSERGAYLVRWSTKRAQAVTSAD